MKEGHWINYRTGKVFPINEHESWIRIPGNAKKLGISPTLVKTFGDFIEVEEREHFLIHLMRNCPVMRERGHGNYITFEFWNTDVGEPLEAIHDFCKDNCGPFTYVLINNLAKKDSVEMPWNKLQSLLEAGDDSKIMKAATKMVFSSEFDYLELE